MNNATTRCRGCSTVYGNGIKYCRKCDGYIEQINRRYNDGFILRGGKFVKQENQ